MSEENISLLNDKEILASSVNFTDTEMIASFRG